MVYNKGDGKRIQHVSPRCWLTSISQVNIRSSQRITVSITFTDRVTCPCHTSHWAIQYDIGVYRNSRFWVLSVLFLDNCKGFSECRLDTNFLNTLGWICPHGGSDPFGLVWDASWLVLEVPKSCLEDGSSANRRVAEFIWEVLSRYENHWVDMTFVK